MKPPIAVVNSALRNLRGRFGLTASSGLNGTYFTCNPVMLAVYGSKFSLDNGASVFSKTSSPPKLSVSAKNLGSIAIVSALRSLRLFSAIFLKFSWMLSDDLSTPIFRNASATTRSRVIILMVNGVGSLRLRTSGNLS